MGDREMYRFINGDEALNWFLNKSKLPVRTYHKRTVKLWPGQFLAMYRYRDSWNDPEILGKLRVLTIEADAEGVFVRIGNMTTGELATVRNIPSNLFGSGVALALPPRTSIERTVKLINDQGDALLGVSTIATFYHKQPLHPPPIGQICIRDWKDLPTIMAAVNQ